MYETNISGFNGQPIHCYIWDDVKNPKAVMQISHGMCEHAGRYDDMARYFNSRGYIVFADDHRAHGKTETEKDRGRHSGDIFEKTLRDLVCFNRRLTLKYKLPTVFLGHSYGSFLGQGFLEQHTDACAVALCGTADMNGAQAGLALIWPLELFARNWRPKFVNKASDILFAPAYKGDHGPSQWVTSDLEHRQAFIDDPMANIPVSVNFDWSMLKAFGKLYTKESLDKIDRKIPVAIFSGEGDPIGGKKSAKAIKLAQLYRETGIEDVRLTTYPGARHELFSEYCKDKFYRDVADFFDEAVNRVAEKATV